VKNYDFKVFGFCTYVLVMNLNVSSTVKATVGAVVVMIVW
jgi:hypothetical protein